MKIILAVLIVLGVAIFIYKSFGNKTEKNKNSESQKKEKQRVFRDKSEYTIRLKGEKMVHILLGEEFSDPGVEVVDSKGNIIEKEVKIDNADLITSGEHKIVYTVTDEKGNEAQAERIINVAPNKEYQASGLSICMYHYVYETGNPPENLNVNFMDTEHLEQELKYLRDNDYYFPTWKEVREYLDGERILPEKSIVLTFDDGPNYIELAIPLLEKYKIPATSFVITSYYNDKEMLSAYKSDFLTFESHSHNMHRGGGNIGRGGIFTVLEHDAAISDLKKSIEMCGSSDAFAYPFGDYTPECEKILEEAEFMCAVTTEGGKCYPGDDPYALKRVRMTGEQTLDSFIGKIQ